MTHDQSSNLGASLLMPGGPGGTGCDEVPSNIKHLFSQMASMSTLVIYTH